MTALRILVADDDAAVRRLLCVTLQPLTPHLIEVEDGSAALHAFHTQAPDLVILDVFMPGMTGLDVLRHIRAGSLRQTTPIILVTAAGERGRHLEALQAGATDFLEKPIDRQLLLARARHLLELQRLRREQVQMVEFIVHDLKQPLSVLGANGQWLLTTSLTADQREAVSDMMGASVTIRGMVEEILAISRLEHAELPLKCQQLLVRDFIGHAVPTWKAIAEQRNVGLAVDCAVDANVLLDPTLMQRATGNVIQNAARYAKSRIHIDAVVQGSAVELRFANDGPPIPPDHKARLFEKYGQFEGTTRGSAGLGLYFCRLVLERHRGSISVEQTPEWPVRFNLSLPLTSPAQAGYPGMA